MRAGLRALQAASQFRFSAHRARVPYPPWQRLLPPRRRPEEYRRSIRDEQEAPGNARKPQCVLSRNSIHPEEARAHGKRQAFPRPGKHRAAKKSPPPASRNRKKLRQNANGAQWLCQSFDRGLQAPWSSPSLERGGDAFLQFAIITAVSLLQGFAVSCAVAICPSRWERLPHCIRNKGRFQGRSAQLAPRSHSQLQNHEEALFPPRRASRDAHDPREGTRQKQAHRASAPRSP